MMSFPARLLMCQVRVNTGPALLMWFHTENLKTVVNVIREYYILDMEGGGLAEDVQNRETNREERTEHKHNAKEEKLTGQSQRLHIVGWNWRKIPTQRQGGTSKTPVHSRTGRQQRFSGKVFMTQPESDEGCLCCLSIRKCS